MSMDINDRLQKISNKLKETKKISKESLISIEKISKSLNKNLTLSKENYKLTKAMTKNMDRLFIKINDNNIKMVKMPSDISKLFKKQNKSYSEINSGIKKLNVKLNSIASRSRHISKEIDKMKKTGGYLIQNIQVYSPGSGTSGIIASPTGELEKNISEIKDYSKKILEAIVGSKLRKKEEQEDFQHFMEDMVDENDTKRKKYKKEKDIDDGIENKNFKSLLKSSLLPIALAGAGVNISKYFNPHDPSAQIAKASLGLAQPGGISKTLSSTQKTFNTIKKFFGFSEKQIEKETETLAGKEVVKITEAAVKASAKETEKVAGKTLGKILGKKIPLVGVGLGLAFAASRAKEGDYWGAGLEVASGIASLVPGVGTAVSLLIDSSLIIKDLTNNSKNINQAQKQIIKETELAAKLAKNVVSDSDYMKYKNANVDLLTNKQQLISSEQNFSENYNNASQPIKNFLDELVPNLNKANTPEEVDKIYNKFINDNHFTNKISDKLTESGILEKYKSQLNYNRLKQNISSIETPEFKYKYGQEIKNLNPINSMDYKVIPQSEFFGEKDLGTISDVEKKMINFLETSSRFMVFGSKMQNNSSVFDTKSGNYIADKEITNDIIEQFEEINDIMKNEEQLGTIKKINPKLFNAVNKVLSIKNNIEQGVHNITDKEIIRSINDKSGEKYTENRNKFMRKLYEQRVLTLQNKDFTQLYSRIENFNPSNAITSNLLSKQELSNSISDLLQSKNIINPVPFVVSNNTSNNVVNQSTATLLQPSNINEDLTNSSINTSFFKSIYK